MLAGSVSRVVGESASSLARFWVASENAAPYLPYSESIDSNSTPEMVYTSSTTTGVPTSAAMSRPTAPWAVETKRMPPLRMVRRRSTVEWACPELASTEAQALGPRRARCPTGTGQPDARPAEVPELPVLVRELPRLAPAGSGRDEGPVGAGWDRLSSDRRKLGRQSGVGPRG